MVSLPSVAKLERDISIDNYYGCSTQDSPQIITRVSPSGSVKIYQVVLRVAVSVEALRIFNRACYRIRLHEPAYAHSVLPVDSVIRAALAIALVICKPPLALCAALGQCLSKRLVALRGQPVPIPIRDQPRR